VHGKRQDVEDHGIRNTGDCRARHCSFYIQNVIRVTLDPTGQGLEQLLFTCHPELDEGRQVFYVED
jgi:hypothetical protein